MEAAILSDVNEENENISNCETSMDQRRPNQQSPNGCMATINHTKSRYPFCIVWTPIPILTWIFPFIGHMGIAMSNGVIRDFAGAYYVSSDNMAFGKPTKYWKLDPYKARGGPQGWDIGVSQASEIYSERVHNLCCDNCHSHVATALIIMQYNGTKSWNMIKLCFLMLIHGKFVNFCAILKTWLPFLLLVCGVISVYAILHWTK